MVEKLYWLDAYTKSFDAIVSNVDGDRICLDKTAFYSTGGGQPNDVGKLLLNGSTYSIIDVKEVGDDIVHTSDRDFGAKVGEAAHGNIDWQVRYAYMRHHTALHVIGGITEKDYGGKWTGGMIYQDRAHMDYDFPALNRELAEKIISEANSIVVLDKKVRSRFIDRDTALKIPDLIRTKPGEELVKRLERVRIVEIDNFDTQTDGGTHVSNTKEIGRIKMSKFDNKGSHRKRIEIVLGL